jgi:AAA+ ATPase superfamily predicted ATPase
MALIGRDREVDILQTYYESEDPEFVVVYGRRRVGKTFLIRECFNDEFYFYFTGIANSNVSAHMERFGKSVREYGLVDREVPKTWMEAFDQLESLVRKSKNHQRKVLFFDEMPWMDTARSEFLPALEYFWNSFASRRKDILLIVCGSAASWMTNKLFKNKGGLHNRITGRVFLQPFTLEQCEQYLKSRKVSFGRYDIVECYMVFGGIPYYLRQLNGAYSLTQNIDRLFFAADAPLRDEFINLYASLFKNSESYIEVIKALSKKAKGLTRNELVAAISISDGGTLTNILEELELSGFIRTYQAFPQKNNGSLYQLMDNFSLFCLRFTVGKKGFDEHYWSNIRESGMLNAWRGYAFEQVCLAHLYQIKQALGISGVLVNASSWRSRSSTPAVQIDLVLDRGDNLINLCEIKYSKYKFEITKDYEETLRNRQRAFAVETGTRKTVHTTLITTYGIKINSHSGIVNSEVTMNQLFQ